MDDFVRDMHTRSGLLAAIEASTTTPRGGRTGDAGVPPPASPDRRTVPLAGNSIGTDRRFLAAELPEIENYLHYRSVDVSTRQGARPRWYPDAVAGAPAKKTAHRAMDDINESVAELTYYRGTIFQPPKAKEPPGPDPGGPTSAT